MSHIGDFVDVSHRAAVLRTPVFYLKRDAAIDAIVDLDRASFTSLRRKRREDAVRPFTRCDGIYLARLGRVVALRLIFAAALFDHHAIRPPRLFCEDVFVEAPIDCRL